MNELTKEIILTRAVNQMIGEVKGMIRRGEKEGINEMLRKAKKAFNGVKNKAYINGLKEREMNEEVKEELSIVGGLSKEEIEEVEREEKEIHRKMMELWEGTKEDRRMEIDEALKLLNDNSKEALKRTGLKLAIRGNEAGIELLALMKTN
jgi:hypothetical protein